MFENLGTILAFCLFAIAFVILTVSILSRLLRPTRDEGEKLSTYECGEPPIGSSWVRFDMRFYTVALVFLIFDVEVALIYPWALVYNQVRGEELSATGFFAFGEMFFFMLVLGVGLWYVWAKGDLDWNKEITGQEIDRGMFESAMTPPSPVGAEGGES